MPGGDWEQARLRRAGREGPDNRESLVAGTTFLGKVTSTGTLAAGKFWKVIPVIAFGREQEGQAATFTNLAKTILVYFLGPGPPVTGETYECRFVEQRWVAARRKGGKAAGGGIVLGNCFCQVLATLSMVSANESCNYGMFQSCTIQYGPPPPSLQILGFSTNEFTSTSSFIDPITQLSFYYHLTCQYNQFFLSRIFPTFPLGSPYLDGYLYNWIIGGYGNTCTPFALNVGQPFPGSDTTCSVSITG